ncbi:MAG: hypothetical protein MUE51_03885 [Thermoleophilia bacterium]|nr:hypothetical protein [Thermoleophilia bacterium]
MGGTQGVAITASAPDGDTAWMAQAGTPGTPVAPWRLVVTAVCTHGR